MKRNSFILIVSLLIGLLTVPAFAGDLAKPSTQKGNIITGAEISDLYSLINGDSTFSGISINGVSFSDSGIAHFDTLSADVANIDSLNVSGDVLAGNATLTGTVVSDSLDADFITVDSLEAVVMTSDSVSTGNLTVSGTVNGVKVYRAYIIPAGTGAPTATIIENNTGLTFSLVRNSTGSYNLDPGVLISGNIFASATGKDTGVVVSAFEQETYKTFFTLNTYDVPGAGLADSKPFYVELLIYP